MGVGEEGRVLGVRDRGLYKDADQNVFRQYVSLYCFFFFSSRRRHTRFDCDWSSDVCSSDLWGIENGLHYVLDVSGDEDRRLKSRTPNCLWALSLLSRLSVALWKRSRKSRQIGRASCRERV